MLFLLGQSLHNVITCGAKTLLLEMQGMVINKDLSGHIWCSHVVAIMKQESYTFT